MIVVIIFLLRVFHFDFIQNAQHTKEYAVVSGIVCIVSFNKKSSKTVWSTYSGVIYTIHFIYTTFIGLLFGLNRKM